MPTCATTNRQTRNTASRQIRQAKRDSFIRGAWSDCKFFWKHIKASTGFRKIKSFIHPWPDSNKSLALRSANKINAHFCNSISKITDKFTDLLWHDTPNVIDSEKVNNFTLPEIRGNDVRTAIASLPNTASTGADGIYARMLKDSATEICVVLADICNCSISTGIFPDQWKTTVTVPVHKKSDVFDISNYRPISLLPLISKVFEKIVGQKLTDHLETRGLLNTAQHGFRRRRSCETALLRLSSLLFDTRRSKQWSSIVTIDFSKAFDTLNHQSSIRQSVSISY